jgi:hypothetical protein
MKTLKKLLLCSLVIGMMFSVTTGSIVKAEDVIYVDEQEDNDDASSANVMKVSKKYVYRGTVGGKKIKDGQSWESSDNEDFYKVTVSKKTYVQVQITNFAMLKADGFYFKVNGNMLDKDNFTQSKSNAKVYLGWAILNKGENYVDIISYSGNPINYSIKLVEYNRKALTISGVKSSYTYNGTGKKLDISNAYYKFYDGDYKHYSNMSYKSSNTKILTVNSSGYVTLNSYGKATVTITAGAPSENTANIYDMTAAKFTKGTKKVTITVKPAAVSGAYLRNYNSKYKTIKKQLRVVWKKDKLATGYQIQIATNSKFTKGVKKVTISKNSTTSTTFKNLKKGTKYYMRMRAYKKVDSKTTYYGPWVTTSSSVQVQ